PPGDCPAGRPMAATHRLDARVAEPPVGPRPPALQARGARLDPSLALACLAGSATDRGGAGAGAARSTRASHRGRDPPGPGQRALRTLGSLHPRRDLAWPRAAGGLGGAALSLAQGAVQSD